MKKKTESKSILYLHRSEHGRAAPIARNYDPGFKVTAEYRETLPDLMVAVDAIQGAAVPIQQVGVSNFRLPLKFSVKGGKTIVLEASVTGTVSLQANLKGINMSRVVRSFYEQADAVFTLERLEKILAGYRRSIECCWAV